jgi:hypothetical protein
MAENSGMLVGACLLGHACCTNVIKTHHAIYRQKVDTQKNRQHKIHVVPDDSFIYS